MLSESLSEIIAKCSKEFLVEESLIKAICRRESGWVSWSTRYEPNWKWLMTPTIFANNLGITVETEQVFQSTSWGLMQIMGAVARELGFDGHLTMLTQPEMGIFYGTKKLMQLQKIYSKLEDVISAYNAGKPLYLDGGYINQDYVSGVLNNMNLYKSGSSAGTD